MEFRLTMPSDLYATVLGAFAASMVVRVIVAILYSHARRVGTFLEECWSRFRGTHDYWHPFWLGALEVFGYTILLGNALPKYVGAWLALKTVSQWRRWGGRNAKPIPSF